MPHHCQGKTGVAETRPYLSTYTAEQLENALRAIKEKKLSLRKAAKLFNVPLSTLKIKLAGKHPHKPGRQKRLSDNDEIKISSIIRTMMAWKMPFTTCDVCLLVKDYLDRRGIDRVFKDNMPGLFWIKSFMTRHKLTLRNARETISKEEFFENATEELKDVPLTHIFNFGEAYFTDYSKTGQVVVNQSVRRVEQLTENSTHTFSIMFCGDALGNFLPPMVVYKTQNACKNWQKDGPEGAIYGQNQSGRFEIKTFTYWFQQCFLPHVMQLEGKKAIIGEHLGCHFGEEVIVCCQNNNISLISFISNSTNFTPPLDLAVFGPLKKVWNQVLSNWRRESRLKSAIPQTVFPTLLKRAVININASVVQAMKCGFKTCGLLPSNKEKVLNKTQSCTSNRSDVTTAYKKMKENNHSLTINGTKSRGKRKVLSSDKQNGKKKCTKHPEDQELVETIEVDVEETHCAHCGIYYALGSMRWVECEKCQGWYHLQCTGIQFDGRSYYTCNLDDVTFHCKSCL